MTDINREKLIQKITTESDLNYKAAEYWTGLMIEHGNDIMRQNVRKIGGIILGNSIAEIQPALKMEGLTSFSFPY